MTDYIYYLAISCISFVITHYILILYAPTLIMKIVIDKLKKNSKLTNKPSHKKDLPKADGEGIVRQSPDLLYSMVKFDLSKSPLKFTAKSTETYSSLSFFS